tara:strand:+ start:1180 stop:1341 length:162 start_codon:yes stop_codon:yes gene_type:complete
MKYLALQGCVKGAQALALCGGSDMTREERIEAWALSLMQQYRMRRLGKICTPC